MAEREAALAAARETQLREEQLLAVGMQAAGAAHSLSTPINTLTLLVDELASEHASVPGLGDDLALMRGQLSCCREALARLKHGSEPQQAAAPLFAMLAERLSGWRSLRPDVRLHWQPPQGDDPPVRLEAAFWLSAVQSDQQRGGRRWRRGGGVWLAGGGRVAAGYHQPRGLSDAATAGARPAPLGFRQTGWHGAGGDVEPRHTGPVGRVIIAG
nr:hypothetical protein [Paludibacterium denitrificans]